MTSFDSLPDSVKDIILDYKAKYEYWEKLERLNTEFHFYVHCKKMWNVFLEFRSYYSPAVVAFIFDQELGQE